MTAWLFSGDLALLATIPGSRGVTSPETTNIQEARHRFVFCGHDGRGLAIDANEDLVLRSAGHFPDRRIYSNERLTLLGIEAISSAFINFVRITVDQMTAWLFSGDLALLATPPGSRGVTSPKNTTIKEAPHRFVFCGHDGRGLAMTPTRTLFCVLQGIFQIGASTATSGYTCGDRSDFVGVYTIRPDHPVDQMTTLLFSRDLALLATPPGSHGVTLPETTNI
ncbi:hypothetical protein V5799_002456 [Amblyomma americanum]|uniref:Uncharacterized protein n=1 Tax=Amblyomma americanum TaxID=6943 RepID=A0AAQ4CX78_AMBAM